MRKSVALSRSRVSVQSRKICSMRGVLTKRLPSKISQITAIVRNCSAAAGGDHHHHALCYNCGVSWPRAFLQHGTVMKNWGGDGGRRSWANVRVQTFKTDSAAQAEAAFDDDILSIGERKIAPKVIKLPDPELNEAELEQIRARRKERRMQKFMKGKPRPNKTFPSGLPDEKFLTKVRELKVFKSKYFDLNVPRSLWDNQQLGIWVSEQKSRFTLRYMTIEERDILDKIGFVWVKSVSESEWYSMLHELRRFKAVFNNLNVPKRWRTDDFSPAFPRWFHDQPVLFEQRTLAPDKVMKLREIGGYDLRAVTGDDISEEQYEEEYNAHIEEYGTKPMSDFELMFNQLKDWKETYYTCHVPRTIHDQVLLGEWVHRIRRKYKRKIIEKWMVERLNELEFEWRVHQLDARWYSLYHHVRRYKEKYGSADIPEDYRNINEPNWVEASRWIQRQHKLYFKQKLSPHKVRLLKTLGVTLDKPYGPLKINPMLQETDPLRYKKLREKHEELLRKRKKAEKREVKRRKIEDAKELERQELLNWYLPFGDPRFR